MATTIKNVSNKLRQRAPDRAADIDTLLLCQPVIHFAGATGPHSSARASPVKPDPSLFPRLKLNRVLTAADAFDMLKVEAETRRRLMEERVVMASPTEGGPGCA